MKQQGASETTSAGPSPKWTQKDKLRKKLESEPNLSKRQSKKLKMLKKKNNQRQMNNDTLTKRQLYEWNSVIRAFVLDKKLTRFVAFLPPQTLHHRSGC
jgi:hypothetical protein